MAGAVLDGLKITHIITHRAACDRQAEPLCEQWCPEVGFVSLRFHGGLLHFRNFCYHFELKLPSPPAEASTLPYPLGGFGHPPPF